MTDYTPTKTCSKCGNKLPATLEYFHKKKSCKYGVNSYCKKCSAKINIENQRKNPGQARARRNRWVLAHPDKDKESKNRYYQANRDLVVYKATEWQKENPDRVAVKNSRWKRNNPAAVSAMSSKRRAIIAKADGHYTKQDVLNKYDQQKGKCWWCGKQIKGRYHVDHVMPLSRGGSNRVENIVIACPRCNMSKNDKLPSEWIGRLF